MCADPLFVGEVMDDLASWKILGKRLAARLAPTVNGDITDRAVEGYLRGPADQWVSQLTELVVVNGMDSFVFWADGEPIEQTQRFVDVAAATRAAVQEARG